MIYIFWEFQQHIVKVISDTCTSMEGVLVDEGLFMKVMQQLFVEDGPSWSSLRKCVLKAIQNINVYGSGRMSRQVLAQMSIKVCWRTV